MSVLDKKLARLAKLTPPELRSEWSKITKVPVPNMGPTLLALAIAFSMQEKLLGGLPVTQVRELAKLSERYAKTGEIGVGDTANVENRQSVSSRVA